MVGAAADGLQLLIQLPQLRRSMACSDQHSAKKRKQSKLLLILQLTYLSLFQKYAVSGSGFACVVAAEDASTQAEVASHLPGYHCHLVYLGDFLGQCWGNVVLIIHVLLFVLQKLHTGTSQQSARQLRCVRRLAHGCCVLCSRHTRTCLSAHRLHQLTCTD